MNKIVLFKILTVLLSTLFTITVVTAVYSYFVISDYSGKISVEVKGDFTSQPDPEIGFVAQKNGVTYRRHLESGLQYHLYTNERGARVDSAHEPSTPSTDIITIGCSFTWGHGVENEKTYSSVISRKTGLHVMNFGFGSYGTVQSLLLLKCNLDLKPKVVIYGFVPVHTRRNLTPCAPNYSPLCLATPYVDFDKEMTPYIHAPLMPNSVEPNRKFYNEVTLKPFSLGQLSWGVKVLFSRLTRPKYV